MVGTKNNKRAQHTKKLIKKTVLSLLQQKKLDTITVTEVCQKAVVNRTTFYRYYNDVYMCVDAIETEFLESIDIPENASPIEAWEKMLDGFYQHPQISNLVFVEGDTRLLDRLHSSIDHSIKHPSTFSTYQDTYIMLGMQGILKRWVKGGMKETPKQLTKIIIRIIFADDIQKEKDQLFFRKNSQLN